MSLPDNLKKNKFFSAILEQISSPQFKKYLITGFTTFGVEYFSYSFLYKIVFVNYKPEFYERLLKYTHNISLQFSSTMTESSFRALLSSTLVYIVIFWLNFLLNRKWAFESKAKLPKQLFLYGLLFVNNLIIANIILLTFLNENLGIDPMISKILVMGSVVCWNFVLYKKVIYKN